MDTDESYELLAVYRTTADDVGTIKLIEAYLHVTLVDTSSILDRPSYLSISNIQ